MAWTNTNTMTAIALAMVVAACSDDGITPGQSGTNGSSSTAGPASSGGVTTPTTGAGTADASQGGESDMGGSTTSAGTSDTSAGPSSSSGDGTSDGGSSSSDDGGSSSSDGGSSSSDGGPMCQPMGLSCAMGESCCPGLMCCSGIPVPMGAEYCGSPCPISDHRRKRDFAAIDADEVLDKVAALPITSWSYRHEDAAIRHIGPMAQDFMASFEVGASDESIFVIDADGVSLAAIQALYGRLRAAEQANGELRATIDDLETRLRALEAR